MSINRLWRCALVALLLASVSREARGGEREIRADLEAFFLTDDAAQRRELACRIESDPAYKRRKVTKYLHRADLFDQLEPGRVKFKVKLPTGPTRQVTLRVPPRYTPAKKLPLIYALHGGGSNADEIIR
jgi:dipeptidyl aminopeptidase/acylaminoacyl peptidase